MFPILFGHPPTFIELLKNDVNQKDDGLKQRLHLCAPKPSVLNANEIIDAEKPECCNKRDEY
ncbi:hypothetical protein BpHYR1_048663 [Brachionus plicatilis]|uniref:Uncharacterized protein n=1 Tax=Brachionus plicatilis TaxID=10195 RepID=A0A3M7Q4U0_BRAPC|nr:hypothetical protein BpHYR1_048663 [Brachionus plicatilis]